MLLGILVSPEEGKKCAKTRIGYVFYMLFHKGTKVNGLVVSSSQELQVKKLGGEG